MNLNDLRNRIVHDIPTATELNEVFQDVNRVIREINAKIPGIETTETPIMQITDSEVLTLTFAATGKTITDDNDGDFIVDYKFAVGQKIWFYGTGALNVTEMTIVDIGDDVAPNNQITVSEVIFDDAREGTLEGFTVLAGYSWDNVNKELTLKAAVNQLIDVFVNNESLTKKDHDTVFDTANSSELYYTKLGRSVAKLTSGIFGGENDTIKIKILKDIDKLSSAEATTAFDIPQQYEVLMEQGVLYFMLSRPKHAGNMELRDKMQKFYLQAIGDLVVSEINRDVDSIDYDLEYNYQGPSHRV